MIRNWYNQIPHPALKTKRETIKYINWRSLRKALTENRMNSSFPNRWSFSYLKFTKYVTNIIAEPKYKYGQQEQVTVRNHNRSTALERSIKNTGGLKPVLRSQHISVESSSLLHHNIYLWFISFPWWSIDELENLHADRTAVCFEPW